MIVGDLDFECVAVTPYKANPVLIVDPDAVLSGAATLERFQTIARENRQIRKQVSSMNLNELPLDDLSKPVKTL